MAFSGLNNSKHNCITTKHFTFPTDQQKTLNFLFSQHYGKNVVEYC
jgi:hypothetical protein